tara:strand:- start:1006 stop:1284 length:279 start_codon:yes stop_codon:yes gene_type:complete
MIDEVELLKEILEKMVDEPGEVKVKKIFDETGVLLVFETAKKDRAIVIGKQGSTFQAIRTIMNLVGYKNRKRINIKMNEPERELSPEAYGLK